MYHLCTTAAFRTICYKRKILDIRLNIKDFPSVGVTGFEPATTRPPDAYSNRAELHPVAFRSANIVYFSQTGTFLQDFFVSLHKTPCCGRYYSCRADRRFLPLYPFDSNSGCLRRKKCRFSPECFSNAEEFAGGSCDQRISAIFFRAGPVPHFVRRRPRCGIAAVPCQQMLNTKNNSL